MAISLRNFDLFSFKLPYLYNNKYSYRSNKSGLLSILYLFLCILLFLYLQIPGLVEQSTYKIINTKDLKLDSRIIISSANSSHSLLSMFTNNNYTNYTSLHAYTTVDNGVKEYFYSYPCSLNNSSSISLCLDINTNLISNQELNCTHLIINSLMENLNNDHNLNIMMFTKKGRDYKLQGKFTTKHKALVKRELEMDISNYLLINNQNEEVEDENKHKIIKYSDYEDGFKEEDEEDTSNEYNTSQIININRAVKINFKSMSNDDNNLQDIDSKRHKRSLLKIKIDYSGQTEISNPNSIQGDKLYLNYLCLLGGGFSTLYFLFSLIGFKINRIEFEKEVSQKLYDFIIPSTSNTEEPLKFQKKISDIEIDICQDAINDNSNNNKTNKLDYNSTYFNNKNKNDSAPNIKLELKSNSDPLFYNKQIKIKEPHHSFIKIPSVISKTMLKDIKETSDTPQYSSDEIVSKLEKTVKTKKSKMKKTEEGIYIINERIDKNDTVLHVSTNIPNTHKKPKEKAIKSNKGLKFFQDEFDISSIFKLKNEFETIKYLFLDIDQLNLFNSLKFDKKVISIFDVKTNKKRKIVDLSENLVDYNQLKPPSIISSLSKVGKDNNYLNEKLLMMYKKAVKYQLN